MAPRDVPSSNPTDSAEPIETRINWREPLLIVAVCLTLYLAGNARTGLWDRDEPRNAVAVHEMRARGDWLFPTFNGEPRYHKPILNYWLMGLATAVVGETPAGARLHSALAGTATCLLVWLFGRRMLGARAGLIAALMLAVSPIMVVESKLATTDATLTLWLVGCWFCLWELGRRDSGRVAAVFWGLLSLAMLTKGPVGPAFLVLSGALAWWWGWPARTVWRRLHPRRGLLGFVLLSAPWYLMMLLGTKGQFLQVAVNQQLVNRVTTGMEQHGAPPGFYIALSVLVFFPWSCLAPMAILGAWRKRKQDPTLAFLLGWVIGPLILLECVQTKMIHYYLPSYPALALLGAWLVVAVVREEVALRRWSLGRLGQGMLGGIGLAAGVGLPASAVMAPASLRVPLIVCGLIIGLGTLAGMLRFQRGETEKGVFGLVAVVGLLMLTAVGWLIPAAEPFRVSRVVGERLAALEVETGLEPLLLDYQEPGVIYSLRKPVALARNRESLLARLDEKGAVLTAVAPKDAQAFAKRLGVTFTPIEDVSGFNVAKGGDFKLQLAIVRKASDENQPEASTALGTVGEQPLVK